MCERSGFVIKTYASVRQWIYLNSLSLPCDKGILVFIIFTLELGKRCSSLFYVDVLALGNRMIGWLTTGHPGFCYSKLEFMMWLLTVFFHSVNEQQ